MDGFANPSSAGNLPPVWTSLLVLVLAAKPAPSTAFQLAPFEREVEGQRRTHAQLKGLPWTAGALKRLIPETCAGERRDGSLMLPLELHEQGGVRLAFGRGDTGFEVTVLDLAGHPSGEARPTFDGIRETGRALHEQASADLQAFRPAQKTVGFWFKASGAGVAQGQVLLGGRFLVRVLQTQRPADATVANARAAELFECFRQVKYATLLAETRLKRR